MRRSRSQPHDGGFSLVEVLIVIVVMGVISGVLVAVSAVVFRNVPSTEARAEDARSMMGLVTWLPQDVDSTPPTGFDQGPSTPSGCGATHDGGKSVLHLTWTEDVGGTVATYIANYRYVTIGDTARLVRVTCSGTSLPYTNGLKLNLTAELPPLPATWNVGDAPIAVTINRDLVTSDVTIVEFAVTTLSGDVVQVDSAPKNPAETLPSTTLPSWYLPTPTTVLYSNTLPTASSHTISVLPDPVITTVNLSVSDIDGHSLIVSLVPTTIPGGWSVSLLSTTLTIIPPPSAIGATETISYTVDDQQGGGVVTGTVTVTVTDPSGPTTTTTAPATTTTAPATTTLPPACDVLGASLSRSSIKNVQADGSPGQVSVGVLFKEVTVTATTNSSCSGLLIRYDTGGVNSPGFLNLTQDSLTTWSGTLLSRDEGSNETWTDGDHVIRFESATGGPYAPTATLTVT